MSLNLCRAAGEIRMKALPGLDLTKLSLPDIAFTKPNPPALWYRFSFLPAASWRAHGDAGQRRFRGLFQVTVFAPAGKGQAALTLATDAVISHFGNQRLTQGVVTLDTGDPMPGPPNTETDWTSLPISIPFETV